MIKSLNSLKTVRRHYPCFLLWELVNMIPSKFRSFFAYRCSMNFELTCHYDRRYLLSINNQRNVLFLPNVRGPFCLTVVGVTRAKRGRGGGARKGAQWQMPRLSQHKYMARKNVDRVESSRYTLYVRTSRRMVFGDGIVLPGATPRLPIIRIAYKNNIILLLSRKKKK